MLDEVTLDQNLVCAVSWARTQNSYEKYSSRKVNTKNHFEIVFSSVTTFSVSAAFLSFSMHLAIRDVRTSNICCFKIYVMLRDSQDGKA